MPELPEVETIRRGLGPLVVGREVVGITVRRGDLRWPVPEGVLGERWVGARVRGISRRGKYLLFETGDGAVMIHLGMSGVLRVVERGVSPGRHDHLDFLFDQGLLLRLTDPRRFGSVLWLEQPLLEHPLLNHLGPEPLEGDFTGAYLYGRSRGRRVAVKNFIMDAKVVVGVGNIYAAEALFRAGIHPGVASGEVSKVRWNRLVMVVKEVLQEAIEQGGTTFRDFRSSEGKPGYFAQKLAVYGREGQGCFTCGGEIREIRLGNRASCFCPGCQK
ncbi:MAG: bifunctional DNA-formamidopyrimidine glycosylase/DNA-(apurinic or apyrimidinic site) lyase [Magnetococcales bacterium]|nr:bifunctional DNA-formamidopyrimidine glycosylase/DNA-(apurinic or apyrimidinic site) lyase [Magnetococcales bacterium]